MSNKALQEAAEKIEPYIVEEVDADTGLHIYKLSLPKPLYAELQHLADREHISLRELLTRAARLYLALDVLAQEPGTYYTRHRPGKPDEIIIFPL